MVRRDGAVTVCGGFLETGKWNYGGTLTGTYTNISGSYEANSVEQYLTFLIQQRGGHLDVRSCNVV